MGRPFEGGNRKMAAGVARGLERLTADRLDALWDRSIRGESMDAVLDQETGARVILYWAGYRGTEREVIAPEGELLARLWEVEAGSVTVQFGPDPHRTVWEHTGEVRTHWDAVACLEFWAWEARPQNTPEQRLAKVQLCPPSLYAELARLFRLAHATVAFVEVEA